MAKVINSDCCEEFDDSRINYGEYYDPFMYGFTIPAGYRKKSTDDKYVKGGSFDIDSSELDLDVEGGDSVKIKLPTSKVISAETEDKFVKSGTSTINEDEQSITLDISGKETSSSTQVKINLSGMSDTYYNKSEINEKLEWGTF